MQEDGNKAPCYPANTVIARSAHNGTLATHSFRTHEPTEFRRKGVNLVNKFQRTSFSFWSLSRFSKIFFYFLFLNNSCVIFSQEFFGKEVVYFFFSNTMKRILKNYNKYREIIFFMWIDVLFLLGRGFSSRETCGSPARLCKTRYNTTAPMYGVSLTSGQPVTIVQKFPDLLQQVVFEVCEWVFTLSFKIRFVGANQKKTRYDHYFPSTFDRDLWIYATCFQFKFVETYR